MKDVLEDVAPAEVLGSSPSATSGLWWTVVAVTVGVAAGAAALTAATQPVREWFVLALVALFVPYGAAMMLVGLIRDRFTGAAIALWSLAALAVLVMPTDWVRMNDLAGTWAWFARNPIAWSGVAVAATVGLRTAETVHRNPVLRAAAGFGAAIAVVVFTMAAALIVLLVKASWS